MPRDGGPARARLREAALALYREHGYDATTTARIAERAGVSERTFFRHFADKREVLFDGEAELRAILVGSIAAAPAGRSPLNCVLDAFAATVPLIVANRALAARRAEVLAVTPALRERGYAKAESLVESLVEALGARGVDPVTARLAGRVGMAAFEYAHRRWEDEPDDDLGRQIARAAAAITGLSDASAG